MALLPLLAAALFVTLLARRGLGPLDFWWGMSLAVVTLVGLSILTDKSQRSSLLQDWKEGRTKKIVWGLFSALGLYAVFWAGNTVSRLVLPAAAIEIDEVYGFGQGAAALRVGLLIVLVIGPGEEIFWRGFVQRRWQDGLGPPLGWLLAAAFYALVHVGSGNFILVLSALVCGLYWGWLYARFRSALLVAVSHTVWDVTIFLILPLGPGG
jgi:membrane protease YdiL (CAAX protease family)